MRRYVALLRAVNVGGTAVITMEALRKLFSSCGLSEVSTYIQTGNVLFQTAESDRGRLARTLERKVASATGREARVFLLTPKELKAAAARNPFASERLDGVQRCQLTFLSEAPDATHRRALMKLEGPEYRFQVRGKVLYWAYPLKFDGKRRTINFERVLGVTATTRGWGVVNALIKLADEKSAGRKPGRK